VTFVADHGYRDPTGQRLVALVPDGCPHPILVMADGVGGCRVPCRALIRPYQGSGDTVVTRVAAEIGQYFTPAMIRVSARSPHTAPARGG
jgi:hypothetical protein